MTVRPVRVVGAGGTIAMRGAQAAPALETGDLIAAVPELGGVSGLDTVSVRNAPGAALGLDGALAVAEAACSAADEGGGVVVTSGTDTIEELAVLIDLMHDGEPPIVVTGAIRPASALGADGPVNLSDAVAVAGAGAAGGLGCVVVFGGQIHAARWVRKHDATGPLAFGSSQSGPLGWVEEGRPVVLMRPERRKVLRPERLDARVDVVIAGLGDDGALLRAAVASGADGVVLAALGAGHLPPGVMDVVEELSSSLPIVVTVRPERGTLLRQTYGCRGSERDVRGAGVVPAGRLSPAAARITLIAALACGLAGEDLHGLFADHDR